MTRRAVFAALLVLSVLVPAQPSAAAARPTSMSALGDSITRAYNACGWFIDCTSRSWATGSYSTVNSHARRLAVTAVYNDARTGAKAAALPTQAATAASRGVGYVTVLVGANDACTRTEAEMTSVASFRASVASALRTLSGRSVFVASIPDLYRLWQVGKVSSSARAAWSAYRICQSMLANPTSTTAADESRRQRVRQRVIDFNAVLQSECAAIAPACVYDGGAVFGYPFSLSQLTTWDYFHPNTAGQAELARVTWERARAGFLW